MHSGRWRHLLMVVQAVAGANSALGCLSGGVRVGARAAHGHVRLVLVLVLLVLVLLMVLTLRLVMRMHLLLKLLGRLQFFSGEGLLFRVHDAEL